MSLFMNTLPVSATGTEGARTEQRPRYLLQCDNRPDADQLRELKDSSVSLGATGSFMKPYVRPHGNAQPQEPPFHNTWCMDKRKARLVSHPHPKPWSLSCQPGKKESPEGENVYHRVWLMETGERGRWNKARKEAFYKKQDAELSAKIPNDEKFCSKEGNYKFWTHLQDEGLRAGGQAEKLDYMYNGPNTNKTHFYIGKFDNVRHCQRILRTGWKDPHTEKSKELHKDTREPFDNRLHDDIILRDHLEFKRLAQLTFDTMRPRNTRSCPQLGADFVNRGC